MTRAGGAKDGMSHSDARRIKLEAESRVGRDVLAGKSSHQYEDVIEFPEARSKNLASQSLLMLIALVGASQQSVDGCVL